MQDMNNDHNDFNTGHLILIMIITILLVSITGVVLIFLGSSTTSLLAELLIIVPAALYVFSRKMPFFKSFRLNKVNGDVIASSLLMSLSLFVIGDELDRLIYKIFPMPAELMESLKYMLQFDTFIEGFIIILSGVFFAAIAEEMLFRGALQRTLEKQRDAALAIVLSSVFFAIIHFNPWSALQIMFIGLFLGYMAWKSDSIIPSMIMHGLNNLLSIVFLNMPERSLSWYAGEEHVRLHWIILALFLLFLSIKWFNSICSRNQKTV